VSDTIPFKCPSCGQVLKTAVRPKSYDDFVAVPCAACGAMFAKDDLKRQLTEFAITAAKAAFKRP
jgi:hypothetical protein